MNGISPRAAATVALLTVFLLGASPGGSPPPSPGTPSPQAGESPSVKIDDAMIETAKTYRYAGDLDGMRDLGIIRLLVVPSKTFYFLDGPMQRGVIYDVAKQFEAFLNKKLGKGRPRIDLAFIPVRRDQLLTFLLEGKGDIAAADLTITSQRAEKVDFSAPFNPNVGVSEFVVTGPAAPPLTAVEDLAGQEVYVRASSSYHETLLRWNDRFRKEGKPEIVFKAADENLEDEDILELVNAGVVGVTVVDSYLASFWKDIYEEIRVREDLALKTDDRIGWAFRKGSPDLAAVLNEFVRLHPVASRASSPILRRYLLENRWLRNPTSEAGRTKFRQTIDVFRQYGAQYDLNYLLVAAQAYQESGLDQTARSPSGAVGIMQIKPATAAADPVHIHNVELLENNVHAGVKYLRFFIDTYYADENMTPLNKALFAFASYNAGPGRISQLRRKAADQDLDPNQWFDNVEVVVARYVGRETVQYVRNIFMYFVAYQLIQEREEMREKTLRKEKSGAGK